MDLLNLGYPRSTLHESIQYWNSNAYFQPVEYQGFILWGEFIGDTIFPHFCHVFNSNNYKPTVGTVRYFNNVLNQWMYQSGLKMAVVICKRNSPGYRIARIVGFHEMYILGGGNTMMVKTLDIA